MTSNRTTLSKLGMRTNQDPTEKADRIILEKYQASFMSDTKWHKLLDGLCEILDVELFVNYKLIYSDEVFQTSFLSSDFKPFFIEPIFYKEVEWLEFPLSYTSYISENNHKAGKGDFLQDVEEIFRVATNLGKYEVLKSDQGLKVFGYK